MKGKVFVFLFLMYLGVFQCNSQDKRIFGSTYSHVYLRDMNDYAVRVRIMCELAGVTGKVYNNFKDSLFTPNLDYFLKTSNNNEWNSITGRKITQKKAMVERRTQSVISWTRLITFFLVSLIILMGSLLYFIFRSNRLYRRRNKYLSHLIATEEHLFTIISHDLRGPVLSLKTFSEGLTKNLDHFSNGEVENSLRKISATTNNIMLLLNNLLDWSRSRSGSLKISPEREDLDPIVRNCVDLYTAYMEDKQLECIVDLHGDLFVFADRRIVELVFRNLLNNAVKFTPEGGTIVVRGYEKGESVFIEVSDTGIGMTRDEVERFNLLATGRIEPEYDVCKGLGLYLSLEYARKFIRQISAISEGQNKGSTFFVRFSKYNYETT